MKLHNLLAPLFWIILISCHEIETEIETGLFQLETNGVRYRNLQRQGFKKTSVDVMMFEKSFGDTTVFYEFDTTLSKLLSKSWTFSVQSNFSEQIENLFSMHEVYLMVPQSYDQIEVGKNFCVKSHRDNLVFFCTIEKRGGYMIDVMYYYTP